MICGYACGRVAGFPSFAVWGSIPPIRSTDRERKMTTKIGFMCSTAFHTEIEGHDAKIYVSAALLKKKETCWKTCGIVKVSVKIIEEVCRGK